MKQILFALGLLASQSLFAQHIFVEADESYTTFSVHDVVSVSGIYRYTAFQSSIQAPAEGLKVMYQSKRFQYGASLGYRELVYKYFAEPDLPSPGLVLYPQIQNKDREIPFIVFANRVVKFKRLEVHGGINVQYIYVSRKASVSVEPGHAYTDVSTSGRLSGGVQAGANWFAGKRIGITAEVEGCYNNFPAGALDRNGISFPVAVGIRYRVK